MFDVLQDRTAKSPGTSNPSLPTFISELLYSISIYVENLHISLSSFSFGFKSFDFRVRPKFPHPCDLE